MVEPINVESLKRSLDCGGTPASAAVARVAEKLNEVIAAITAEAQRKAEGESK